MTFTNVAILIAVISFVGVVVNGQNGAPCHSQVFQIMPRHALNLTQFAGTWYIHEYASSDIGNTPPPTYKCLSINLTRPNASEPTQLRSQETYIDIETDIVHTGIDSIQVRADRSPLSSLWNVTSEAGQNIEMIIQSTDLDFNRWAIFYSCQHIGPDNYRWETVTAMTRSRNLDPELRSTLKALMLGSGFHLIDHQVVRQDNC